MTSLNRVIGIWVLPFLVMARLASAEDAAPASPGIWVVTIVGSLVRLDSAPAPRVPAAVVQRSAAAELVTSAHASASTTGSCPSRLSPEGAGCTTRVNAIELSYADCALSGGTRWKGGERLVVSGGAPSCGQPQEQGLTGSIHRSYLPKTSVGEVELDSSRGLKTYTGVAVPGGGASLTFVAGQRQQAEIGGIRLRSKEIDYTIETQTLLSVDDRGSEYVVDGPVRVFDNKAKTTSTWVLRKVVFRSDCRGPVGGSLEIKGRSPASVVEFAAGCPL